MPEPDNKVTPGQEGDAIAVYLAAARERWNTAGNETWHDYATALELLSSALRSAADVPRLLGAVEIALKQHRGGEVITFAACSEHNIIMTMGDPLRFARMRECPDCIKTAHLVCETCDEDWPCNFGIHETVSEAEIPGEFDGYAQAAEDLAARLRALENEVESLRARNAKLRDRAEYLERQTGALSVDRDRSVQAALLRSERCEEHGRDLMHWQRTAEWFAAACAQQETARFDLVTPLLLASSGRDFEIQRDGKSVRIPVPPELARWMGEAAGAQKKVKRKPPGWPPLEEFLHAGCSCSTVPTDGIACWQAQGLLFSLPEDGAEGMDPR